MNKKIKKKDYRKGSRILGVIIAFEIVCIVAFIAVGVHTFNHYHDMNFKAMDKSIEEKNWDSLLSWYKYDYNPDIEYTDRQKMIIATAEYYDHANLYAAAVFSGDEETQKREKEFMNISYESMGDFQACSKDIDNYIEQIGKRNE